MQLSKFGHSCIRFDDGGRALVIDPGGFSDAAAALAGADAVLITHEHVDHLDEAALRSAVAAHPGLPIWAPAGVAATLADLGSVTAVGGGESFTAAGFSVQTFGGQHALIHPSIPVVANVGFLIDGAVYHPGDSLIVPEVAVSTLLAPIHAPWSKLAEVTDFMVAVRAPQVFSIHDALLNDNGFGLVDRLCSMLTAPYGVTYAQLAAAATVTL